MATVLVAWSGGKDSALMLHRLWRDPAYKVVGLVTTFQKEDQRTPFHGIPYALMHHQAQQLALPLIPIWLPAFSDNIRYEHQWQEVLKQHPADFVAFGDIFLEDLHTYRYHLLRNLPHQPLFPLWQEQTIELIHEFFNCRWKAVVVCVDRSEIDPTMLGAELTPQWIENLPSSVDICGERGEFHTFVWDGPLFQSPISIQCTGCRTVVGPYVRCEIQWQSLMQQAEGQEE